MGIQEYLNDILEHQLREVKYRYREKIAADIKDRMCSLLSKWDREEYRRTILFVTDEEALFYEPDAPIEVKEFVVAALRNSMLEIAASVNYSQFKMQEPLSNNKIRELTADAILYFRQCEFKALQEEANGMEFKDVFGEAIKKYPVAWKILKKAALMEGEKLEFGKTEKIISENEEWSLECKTRKTVVCDGYSLEFDAYLKEELKNLISGIIDVFYVDSFKMLARNFEKVLHVLQIIFENDKVFVTCNYYMSDGYIEKRKKIVRAAHSQRDAFENIRKKGKRPERLKNILEEMTKAEF